MDDQSAAFKYTLHIFPQTTSLLRNVDEVLKYLQTVTHLTVPKGPNIKREKEDSYGLMMCSVKLHLQIHICYKTFKFTRMPKFGISLYMVS